MPDDNQEPELFVLHISYHEGITTYGVPNDRPFRLEMFNSQDNDLTPLEGNEFLMELAISGLHRFSLDLSPLASCRNLRNISITDCPKLSELDLSPLRSCKSLKLLTITDLKIRSLDLSPLAGCESLRVLTLEYNKIRSIDLSSLAKCKSLTEVSLMCNKFRTINITPIQEKKLILHIDDKMQVEFDRKAPVNITTKMGRCN